MLGRNQGDGERGQGISTRLRGGGENWDRTVQMWQIRKSSNRGGNRECPAAGRRGGRTHYRSYKNKLGYFEEPKDWGGEEHRKTREGGKAFL